MTKRPSVSLIATVKNERPTLDAWLAGIENQSQPPDEIVIVDGGSLDGTWETLSQWCAPCDLVLLRVAGASISFGRNLAISKARSDVIAITDAGTVADTNWLEKLTGPFVNAAVDVSAGFFRPAVAGAWQRSLAATTLPDSDEIQVATFLPSSRSVAIRSSWVQRGFEYPEWLDYCEDLVWDLQLKRGGARFVLSQDAVVDFAVRSDWLSFWRQYFRYARGDGKSGLFAKRHAIRYISYIIGGVLAVRARKLELAMGAVLGCAYVYKPVVRLSRRDRLAGVRSLETLGAFLLIPAHVLIGDVAKMVGYPVGLVWRWKRFGAVGPRTSWRRIRPDGSIWHPRSTAAETPPQEV